MPDRLQSVPAPWSEGDAIRESILLYIDDPEHREILRSLGRVIFDLAIECTRLPFEVSITHAELRAAIGDLRHVEGLLDSIRRSADESDLAPEGPAKRSAACSASRI
jgi:hypothetical protein